MKQNFGGIPSAKKTLAAFLAYAENEPSGSTHFHLIPELIAVSEGISYSIVYVYEGYSFAVINS